MRDSAWDGACFVLGPHRSGTTIFTRSLAESGEFVYLTAAEIVARHRGADQVEPTLGKLVERKETRLIDRTEISADLPEEYGFVLPGRRLTEETAPQLDSVYRNLGAKGDLGRRFLLRNPWDLTRTDLIHRLFPRAVFVFTVRDPVATINSQVRAARKLFGAPSDYHALLDPRYRLLIERRMRFAFYGWVSSRRVLVARLIKGFQLSTDKLVRDLEDLPRDRWIAVRYEDLVREPEKELSRAYGFLGLPTAGIARLAGEIRPTERPLEPHVKARIRQIQERTRLYRERFGY